MNKLLSIALLFSSISYADIDIGDDFEVGGLVAAEAFNLKFGKLKKVVGEIKDEDILGSWDCTSYALTASGDPSYQTENGGNGQVGTGYFDSLTGRLILSEQDSESSLSSPKNYTIDTTDLINRENIDDGFYTLLLNKLHLFGDRGEGNPIEHYINYNINMTDDSTMILSSDLGNAFNPGVICEKVE
jgi:hypothetical protein